MQEKDDVLEAQKAPWNAGAESYADLFDGQVTQSFDPILDSVGAGEGTRLLDVATGPGILAGAAAKRGARVEGVDFAERMIEVARRRYPDLVFEQADAAALPYDEGVFDAVTMSLALFMLPDPDRALAEAHRVLAPGGAFAATVWDWPVPGFEAFYKPYAEFMVTEERLAGSPPLMGVADPGTLKEHLSQAGFTDVNVSPLPIIWRLPESDQLFDALASLRDLSSLNEGQMKDFRSAVRQEAERWRDGETLAIPFPMLLLSCRKH